MELTFHIDIVSAEKEVFSGRVEKAIVTGNLGEICILPGHSQLLTQLQPHPMRIVMPGGEEEVFYISGGVLEVQPQIVTVLSDTAERARDMDEAEAELAMTRAQELLEGKHAEIDYASALAEVARAAAKLRAIQTLRARMK